MRLRVSPRDHLSLLTDHRSPEVFALAKSSMVSVQELADLSVSEEISAWASAWA
jgi:hypothetical protein